MKCLQICVLLTLVFLSNAIELNFKEELKAMAEQIEILKSLQQTDISRVNRDIEELKKNAGMHVDNFDRNEQVTLEWAKNSMHEIRIEMRELGERVNSSVLLHQVHVLRNEMKETHLKISDLVQYTRTQDAQIEKLGNIVDRLVYEGQEMKKMLAQQRSQMIKINKEIKEKQLNEQAPIPVHTATLEHQPHREAIRKIERSHKYRHNRLIRSQISKLSRGQDQLDEFQQSLQTQILDVQRRLDKFEEPNWNLMSAKVDFLETDAKIIHNELNNVTLKVSDIDKIHSTILELREDVECMENKVDKTIPEFRKEISKLDISYAQVNAQASYVKEDVENLRQSVKAIAVSVSNTIDRAEVDRVLIKSLNDSIGELQNRSKQHFHKLNDHIHKSEAYNNESDYTEFLSLPDLMTEVKELQPVESEYEDLVGQLSKDCSTVIESEGAYLINPGLGAIDTWCANGSTLLQRRINGTEDFNRKFSEYVRGFGDPAGEYWIGLETMHRLTLDNCSSMRIDMTDIYGASWYAEYNHFSVSSGDSGYRLDLSEYSGNASDAFEYQNHMEFSAIDRDRDVSNTHCAGNYEGGWWFSHCQHVNINGKYSLGLTWFDSGKNEWIAVATSEMTMYRRPGCSPN